MTYSQLNNKRWSFARDIFWIIYGILIFIPIEVFYEGLYLSYFQIIFLFGTSKKISKDKLFLFILWIIVVCISVFFGKDAAWETLVNPVMVALVLIAPSLNVNVSLMIKRGVYVSAVTISLYLAYLLIRKGLDISVYLNDREWAKNDIPFFGNGLAMLFVMAMLFAVNDKNYKLFLLFSFGGLLTTSRMPVFAMGLILLSHLPGIWTFKRIFILFLCLLFLQLGFESNIISTLSENDLDAMYARLSYADDRAEVFNAALLNLYDNPFFGIGSEKLDFYEHAHNSYLQVAQKFGGYGLIVFLSLVYVAIFRNLSLAGNWLFVALFLIVTSMQIGLLYPNFLILIKVYLSAFSTDKVLVQKMNEKSNVF